MFPKVLQLSIAILLSLLMLSVLSLAQTAYQPVGTSGGIDYGKRVIVAKGIGMPGGIGGRGGQIRAAIMDAQRNYLNVTKGAYVTSETTVENLMMTGDIITSSVEGLVRNYVPVDTAYWDDGTIEVTLEFYMEGSFLDAVLPQSMGGYPPPTYTIPSSGTAYTGLIVDARGLGVRPALAPKIIDTNGKEVYGSSMVSREFAIQQGMVGYAKDPEKARANDRVSPTPYFVKGIRAAGSNKADVVISEGNAAELLGLASNMNFLRKCQVMILVD